MDHCDPDRQRQFTLTEGSKWLCSINEVCGRQIFGFESQFENANNK